MYIYIPHTMHCVHVCLASLSWPCALRLAPCLIQVLWATCLVSTVHHKHWPHTQPRVTYGWQVCTCWTRLLDWASELATLFAIILAKHVHVLGTNGQVQRRMWNGNGTNNKKKQWTQISSWAVYLYILIICLVFVWWNLKWEWDE